MTIEVKNDEMLGRTNNTALHIELIKLQQENQQLKDRINKAIKVINTQMKSADDGIKENLRIIKFNLIKGECRVCDLKTEEDYKY